MPDIVKLREKVVRVCGLNYANNRPAPRNMTELATWLGIAGGTLTRRYSTGTANLQNSLERAIVMALGFGPEDSEFEEYGESVWSHWIAKWGNTWRSSEPMELERLLETANYFVPRAVDDARLATLLPKFQRRSGARVDSASGKQPAEAVAAAAALPHARGRYLDRLASLQVKCMRKEEDQQLRATCTFGTVKIPTDDAVYLVSINWCHAELLLTEASFEPTLESGLVRSRSVPTREMNVRREYSRINHPSWVVSDSQPKTPLSGEYIDVTLGTVAGNITPDDEASLLVYKAGFAVSALSGPQLTELGILTSLLKYLVTEHVGEIELRGKYLYHLSAGQITMEESCD